MSKKDLIDAVARECELTKEKASVAVDAVLAHIRAAMKDGHEVRIPDFGTFKVADRKAREGRNPGDRHDDPDPGVARAEIHACEGPEGRAELIVPVRLVRRTRAATSRARLCFDSLLIERLAESCVGRLAQR